MKFKDYRDLPFPKEIQDLLMKFHEHGENDEIIYKESDVLVILQTLIELLKFNS